MYLSVLIIGNSLLSMPFNFVMAAFSLNAPTGRYFPSSSTDLVKDFCSNRPLLVVCLLTSFSFLFFFQLNIYFLPLPALELMKN